MRSLGNKFPPTLCGRVGEAAPLLLNKRLNCNQELFLLLSLHSWVRYIVISIYVLYWSETIIQYYSLTHVTKNNKVKDKLVFAK